MREHRLRQRHTPLRVALADYAQDHVGLVDCGNLQHYGFADPQATGVHDHKASFVDWIRYAAKDVAYPGVSERNRQALLTRLPNLFLEKSGQSQLSVWQ